MPVVIEAYNEKNHSLIIAKCHVYRIEEDLVMASDHSEFEYEGDPVEDCGIYPILRPLSDLKNMVINKELPTRITKEAKETGYWFPRGCIQACNFNYKGYRSTSNPFINNRGQRQINTPEFIPWTLGQLRWFKENGFCTADFRFENEVQHAKLIKS